MRNRNHGIRISLGSFAVRTAFILVACAIVYYLPVIAGFAHSPSLQANLSVMHDFYGLDMYALLFFVPVVYAAYTLGVKGAVASALACLFIFIPQAAFFSSYSDAFFRPTAFTIILSAVGAVIAMLQRSDEERNRRMSELRCLYDIGRAAEQASSVENFALSVIKIISKIIPFTDETRIRLLVRDRQFQNPAFKPSRKKVSEKLVAGGEELGRLEIYFTGSCYYLKRGFPLMRTLADRIAGAIRNIELEESLNSYYEQLEEAVKQRTEELEKAQEQLRLLSDTVKSSIDGITLADMEGNLTFANEAMQKMWGYSLEEIRQKMSHLYLPEQGDFFEKKVLPVAKTGAWHGELTAVRKDGRRFPIYVTTSPVHDEDGQTVAIVGVHRDITETKAMRDKLIRSERLAAVGELASGVSHELRNPLSVIRNSAYLLRTIMADTADAEILKVLKILDQQVDISNKIITDLLDFTRVRLPALAEVELNRLIKESLLTIKVPGGISVEADVNGKSPEVIADAEQVKRAFINIISNAFESMGGEGKLTISTATKNGHAWVRFEDTGCGIPEENRDKVFQPLFTTKAKGIGLGLAISKKLIEQNSGTIDFVSQVSKGTIFTVTLPTMYKEGA